MATTESKYGNRSFLMLLISQFAVVVLKKVNLRFTNVEFHTEHLTKLD